MFLDSWEGGSVLLEAPYPPERVSSKQERAHSFNAFATVAQAEIAWGKVFSQDCMCTLDGVPQLFSCLSDHCTEIKTVVPHLGINSHTIR